MSGRGPQPRRPLQPAEASHGLVAGGRGEDEELLVDGQEEVFSRTEVERGVIEHGIRTGTGGAR